MPKTLSTTPKTTRPTWVMGHKNPDTDAICSALAYADLLRQTRIPEAVAACCGPPNARTEWVLHTAGINRPRLMSDVNLRASDICRAHVSTARPTESVIEAYREMAAHSYRSLPVTNEDGILIGMLALQDLLALLIPESDKGNLARQVTTSTDNVARILEADIVHLNDSSSIEQDFLMMVAGSSEPVMQDRISKLPKEQLLIITGDRIGVQLHAVEAGVRCLVITSGFRPSEAIIHAAAKNGTSILVTDRDTASTTQLIRGARSISNAVSKDFLSFSPEMKVQAIKERLKTNRDQVLFPVCDPETRKLIGVFSRADLVNPERPRLILVDHNEFSQAVTGADEAEIIEVLDHHRLSGNLVTKEPIQFINKTVGSTCTIVGSSFQSYQIEPSQSIAICICAGIISDTLNLTSPTTTDEDRAVLEWASGIAGIDVAQFKEDFFSAGSVLRSSNIPEAVGSDRKEFDESGYRVSISQVEEIGFDYFWPAREALQAELKSLVKEQNLDLACLMITDITLNDSLLLIEAPLEIRQRIGYPKKDSHLFVLKGVVSRKKQLFPFIGSVLSEIPKSDGV
ncbi:MAG: putative manganese-dependent inorganic diphosphatase [Verrucomicrobiales bacterium]|nr:putative manganese-dependent inorganic diphosphatase [Verrucomicrobiales bacterium]MBP9222840.1 putative manganese-dependent inorganic diphosphatase [Verrucomicrobiales bacterium]HQZ28154.1 putative manganese-dependent inorganic diphosphatase [Verrucomicrobiales bacterium]